MKFDTEEEAIDIANDSRNGMFEKSLIMESVSGAMFSFLFLKHGLAEQSGLGGVLLLDRRAAVLEGGEAPRVRHGRHQRGHHQGGRENSNKLNFKLHQ